MAQILREAEGLVEAGVREITLLGQNVNGYHGLDESGGVVSLAALCTRLAGIPGIEPHPLYDEPSQRHER